MRERIKGKTLIASDEGDVVNGVIIKLYGEETNGAISIIEQPFEPGLLLPPHVHENDVWLHVLEGEMHVRVAEEVVKATPGCWVLKPPAMNAADLSEYCRRRGLFAEQITAWRLACEQANDWDRASSVRLSQATKDEKKRITALERDLQRKEKALAEAAALLVLRKKAEAIWGDGEDA